MMMKTNLLLLFLLPFALLIGCSKDGDPKPGPDEESSQGTGTAYVKFSISGPVTNGDFEYTTNDNSFKSHGLVDYADESAQQPILAGITVYKTLTESFFQLDLPPETGTHNLPFYDEDIGESYGIEFVFNREEVYVGRAVEVKVPTLEFETFYIKKCKGTFSGTFDLLDETGQNLGTHQITGEFERR